MRDNLNLNKSLLQLRSKITNTKMLEIAELLK